MQFLSNPYAVRTKAVENGMNYQFACQDKYVVTVYKGDGDEIGKVIAVEVVNDTYFFVLLLNGIQSLVKGKAEVH